MVSFSFVKQHMLLLPTTFVRLTWIGMDLCGSVRVEMAFTVSPQAEQRGSVPKMDLRVIRFFRSTKIAQGVFGSERERDSIAFLTGNSAPSKRNVRSTKRRCGLFSRIMRGPCGSVRAVADSTV